MMNEELTICDLKYRQEYIREVATLEYLEWANNPEENKDQRINNKISKIKNSFNLTNFCKIILLKNTKLVGFISIFPNDSDKHMELSPWYATMYVVSDERGKGYSKILNDAILKKAKELNIQKLYLKTALINYYEKFGAILIDSSSDENIYEIIIK